MLKITTLCLCVIFVACGTECEIGNPPQEVAKQEMWVCYNPGHELHGYQCVEETDTARGRHQPCLWNKDGSNYGRGQRDRQSFCWLLERRDCSGEQTLQWQKDNCHLFGELH